MIQGTEAVQTYMGSTDKRQAWSARQQKKPAPSGGQPKGDISYQPRQISF